MSEPLIPLQLAPSEHQAVIQGLQALYRERMQLMQALREQRTQAEVDQEAMCLELLEVLDQMDYMIEFLASQSESGPAFMKRLPRSFTAMRNKLFQVMEKRQVGPIQQQDEGSVADFSLSRVVEQEVHPDKPAHTIVKVVKRGYRIGDRVLRPVEVVTTSFDD